MRLPTARNLTQKASLNALAAALDYGARLVVGFLVTPLLVRGLGETLYGVWLVLGRATEYLTVATGRSTQALKWTLARQQHSTEVIAKRRAVGSALAVWLLFFPLVITVGSVVVWFLPTALHLPPGLIVITRIAAAILLIRLIANSLAEVPRSILEGENLGYKRMGLSAAVTIAGGGLTVLALHLETGLLGVAIASLITVLITGLLFLSVVRVNVPWSGVVKPTSDQTRKFLSLSWWFLLWRFVMMLMLASDLLILGFLESVELVTTYSLTKYFPEVLVQIVAAVVFGITPGLGGIIGSGDLKKAAMVRGEIMMLSWLIFTILGSGILLCNREFVRLWVGADHYAGALPTLLILLLMIQLILIRNDANIIDLTLVLPRKVLAGLGGALGAVVIAAILVGHFGAGIVGMVLGLLAGRAVLSFVYPIMVGRFLGTPMRSQIRAALRPALLSSGLFALTASLGVWIQLEPDVGFGAWLRLLFLFAATVGMAGLVSFTVGLSQEQRHSIAHRLSGLANSFSKRL